MHVPTFPGAISADSNWQESTEQHAMQPCHSVRLKLSKVLCPRTQQVTAGQGVRLNCTTLHCVFEFANP